MDFLEAFVETSEIGIEMASGVVYANGVTGIMVEDQRDFSEFMKDPNRQWDYIDDELMKQKLTQKNGITFFVTDNASGIETLNAIKADLKGLRTRKRFLMWEVLTLQLKTLRKRIGPITGKSILSLFPLATKLL